MYRNVGNGQLVFEDDPLYNVLKFKIMFLCNGTKCDFNCRPHSFNQPFTLTKHVSVESCPEGQIYWNYPAGQSKVLFESTKSNFQLCIGPLLGYFESYTRTDTEEVFKVKDYGSEGNACHKIKAKKYNKTNI